MRLVDALTIVNIPNNCMHINYRLIYNTLTQL